MDLLQPRPVPYSAEPPDSGWAVDAHPEAAELQRLLDIELLRTLPLSGPVTLPPMSAEWYDWVERKRYARHGSWIPRLLEFARHPGEQILCLGDGLGTDWVRYARNKAHVTVCGRDAAHVSLLKHPFAVRGLPGRFACVGEPVLPANDHSVDVAVAFRPWFTPEQMGQLSAEM